MMMEKYIKKVEQLVDRYKGYFGLGDWDIDLAVVDEGLSDSVIAYSTDVEVLEKKARIIFKKVLFEEYPDDIVKTVVHELIHLRLAIFQQDYYIQTKELKYYLEERFVNDITRGILELEEDLVRE
ncbi:MAG: hypothetical protein QXN68_00515 [Thermoplasmata archaeon]